MSATSYLFHPLLPLFDTQTKLEHFSFCGNELLEERINHIIDSLLNRKSQQHSLRLPVWYFVCGQQGCGKTHLLEGICHKITDHGGAAFYGKTLPQHWQERLNQTTEPLLLAIDDIDLWQGASGDSHWQNLFVLLNTPCAQPVYLLLGSKDAVSPHREWATPLRADIKTRLLQAEQLAIQQIPANQIATVVKQRISLFNMQIDRAAIDYLYTHSPRYLGVVMRLLDLLNNQSWQQKKRITLPMVRQLLLFFHDKNFSV